MLLLAESKAIRGQSLTMADFMGKFDRLLEMNEYLIFDEYRECLKDCASGVSCLIDARFPEICVFNDNAGGSVRRGPATILTCSDPSRIREVGFCFSEHRSRALNSAQATVADLKDDLLISAEIYFLRIRSLRSQFIEQRPSNNRPLGNRHGFLPPLP